ncbi:MAG: hypothetical protein EOM59_06460 [Clostridia bacterium]|nr:hypothetical protein [Clostridia bacterium]
MLETKAVFERKPTELVGRACIVEKIISMTDSDLEDYRMNLMREQPFIQENVNLMYNDNGVYHCLLVVGETSPDGILIEAEGYSYARYAAFLPNGRILVQSEQPREYHSGSSAIRSLCEKLERCVDKTLKSIAESGQAESDISFEEISRDTGINVEFNDAILTVLHEMLLERKEVTALEASEIGFHLTVSEEQNHGTESADLPRLKDLLACKWEDIHLVHDEIDNDPATIIELSDSTLTAAGREAWADIFNAEVKRIFNGIYGLQMELTGVKASRLDEFSHMLAGYCAVEDYELWVAEGEETCQQMEQ